MKTKIGVDELVVKMIEAMRGDAGEVLSGLAIFFQTFFFCVFNLQCIFRYIKSGNVGVEEAFDIVETLEVLGILRILKIKLEEKCRTNDFKGTRAYIDYPKKKEKIIKELRKKDLENICGYFITPDVYVNLINRTSLTLSLKGKLSIGTEGFNKLIFYFLGEGSMRILGERFAKSVIQVAEKREEQRVFLKQK